MLTVRHCWFRFSKFSLDIIYTGIIFRYGIYHIELLPKILGLRLFLNVLAIILKSVCFSAIVVSMV